MRSRSDAVTITLPGRRGCRYEPFPVAWCDDEGNEHTGHEGWWCVTEEHFGLDCPQISWDGHVCEWWPTGPNSWECALRGCRMAAS